MIKVFFMFFKLCYLIKIHFDIIKNLLRNFTKLNIKIDIKLLGKILKLLI